MYSFRVTVVRLSDSHRRRIREIMERNGCSGDFVCCESLLTDLNSRVVMIRSGIVWCKRRDALDCKRRIPYGTSAMCKCPAMKYVAEQSVEEEGTPHAV